MGIHCRVAWVAMPAIFAAQPAAGQEQPPAESPADAGGAVESLGVFRAEPPAEIDILADPLAGISTDEATPAQIEECRRQQEAAMLREEIVVCGTPDDQSEYRTVSRKDAQARYARETNTQGAFGAPDYAPDVAGPGIFRGKPTIGGICMPLSCPRAMPRMIDLTALPEAPPGSDADRIARGLPPVGDDNGDSDSSGGESEEVKGAPEAAERATPGDPSDADETALLVGEELER